MKKNIVFGRPKILPFALCLDATALSGASKDICVCLCLFVRKFMSILMDEINAIKKKIMNT